MIRQEIKEKCIKRVKKDIQDYKLRKINYLPTNTDYSKEFDISGTTLKNLLRDNLTKEDREYRSSEIESHFGKQSKGNKNFFGISLTRDERALNNLKGEFAEELAKEFFLEGQGWKAVKILIKEEIADGQYRSVLNEEGIRKLKNGDKIMNVLSLLKERMRVVKYPDFVCEKGDLIKFVEVKSSDLKSINDVKQKRTLEELGKLGYDVGVIELPIKREDFRLAMVEWAKKNDIQNQDLM